MSGTLIDGWRSPTGGGSHERLQRQPNGVNERVDGVDVKHRFSDNRTPHERTQTAADVRAVASPAGTKSSFRKR
jgi:hypothetical protein